MRTTMRFKFVALLLLGSCLWAGIQYAGGTNVNTTFTTTVGTRQEIVTGIQTALTTAGWTVISGGGTGNVVMRSATTPTANNSIDVRLYDPGAGNCANVFLRNAAGTLEGGPIYLLPGALKVYRVIANKYQGFVFTPGTSAAREFAAFGVPYIPSFLHGVITGDFGWLLGNTEGDASVTVRSSFRTLLGPTAANEYLGCYATLLNANLVSNCGWAQGCIRTQSPPYNSAVQANTQAYRWHDDSLIASEAFLTFGLATANDEPKIRGQLWDAIVVGDPFAADTPITLDAHSWFAITNSNTGSANAAKGTLFVVIP